MEKLLLTIEEAAESVGISRAALYPLVMSGSIQSIKVGRSRRIPVKALEDWADRLIADGSGLK